MNNNYTSLATKYRPTSFTDGFMGQTVTAAILSRLIENKKFKNVMLFSGASGCGKTTAARIVANLINNNIGSPIEIDAASSNGVNQVRAIIDSANERALAGEYKVFIIDECHMITKEGWNAFLKCIEECPKYTIFIFCTTEPNKIPATVLNRMQRFNFNPIPATDIANKLGSICEQEGFTNYQDACNFISKNCNGCMREAITMLERCADYSTDLSLENVKLVLPGSAYETMFKLTWALQQKNEAEVLTALETVHNNGQDLKLFLDTYTSFILDLVKFIVFKNIDLTNIPSHLATAENAVVQTTVEDPGSLDYFNKLLDRLIDLKGLVKTDLNYKTTIEAVLVSLCREV